MKHLEKTLSAVRLFLRAQEENESKSCLQETPWTDEPGGSQSTGSQELDTTQQLNQASLVAQLVKKIRLQCERPEFDPWVGKIPWRRERLPTPVSWPGEFPPRIE